MYNLDGNTPTISRKGKRKNHHNGTDGVPLTRSCAAPATLSLLPMFFPYHWGGQCQSRRLLKAVAPILRRISCLPKSHILTEATMAQMSSEAKNVFYTDFCLAQDETRDRIIYSTARAANMSWDMWVKFCESINQDPELREVEHPVHILQVFAKRFRYGRLSKRGKPVTTENLAETVRQVAKTLSLMRAPDPRIVASGKICRRHVVRVVSPNRLVVSNAEDSPMRKSSADAQSEWSMRADDRLCDIDRPETTASGVMADVQRRRRAEGCYCFQT